MNSLTEMTAIKTGHALSMKNSSIPLVEIESQKNPSAKLPRNTLARRLTTAALPTRVGQIPKRNP
jgi:hypothetical protein